MRVLAATLAVLLLVAICSLAEADLRISRRAASSQMRETIPPICCLTYTSRPLPSGMIASGYRTSDNCKKPAIVLITKKGKQVCVDPNAPWLEKYLRDLGLLKP